MRQHPMIRTLKKRRRDPHYATLESLESRTLLSGLTGEYFDNPDFTAPLSSRTDATIDFDWAAGAPVNGMGADSFSVAWSGLITPVARGNYRFYLSSDEGARLWVDGQLLIDSWESGDASAQSQAVTLQAGQHYGIRIEYRDVSGAANVRLEWSSPLLPKRVVPSSVLSPMPQATGPATEIMLLGDSITEGFTGHASYRFWLYKQLQSAGYNIDLLGTRDGVRDHVLADKGMPLYPWFDRDHQSASGWTIDQLLSTLAFEDPGDALSPDIAVVMIGNNDLAANFGVEGTITRLELVIDELRRRNPNVKIILTELLPNPVRQTLTQQYNAAVVALAAQRHTASSPVSVVDQHSGFNNATETYDDPPVHPNEAGEKKVAAKFYTAITTHLGHPPHQADAPPIVGSLMGYVYDDVNASGLRDNGEAGIPSRYVYLDYDNDNVRDDDEPITVTSKLGRYLFQGLPEGNHRVRHHLGKFTFATAPAGSVQIAHVQPITPASAERPVYDFGIRSTPAAPPTSGTISGRIFFDANADGQRGGGEKAIANRYVYIDQNANGLFDPIEPFSVTDALGQYSFPGLKAGFYRVSAHIGAQSRSTAPVGGTYYLNLDFGQTIASAHFALALR